MNKRLCVLQVTPTEPNRDHIELFHNKKDCDFYFVTHDSQHADALKFCPNTTWTDTRNILAEMVPKKYDYYAFVDYDYRFHPQGDLGVLEQILSDLEHFNPAVLTCYPGSGLITPFASDMDYKNKHTHSVIPFTHCGMKVVHHSLMNWFFPMVTKFGGGVEACHLFNIMELPFLQNIVCTHQIVYDNGVTDMNAPHNRDGAQSKLNMDKMWSWLYPYFNKRKTLRDKEVKLRWGDSIPTRIEEYTSYTNSLTIKETYVGLLTGKVIPSPAEKEVDYYSLKYKDKIKKFFDINHEHFAPKFGNLKSRNDTIVIVGNGPSLKEEYFEILRRDDIDTFGLNVAYRFFEKMNWYPKFYGCFDYAATNTHRSSIASFIRDKDCPIEKFFLLERPSIEARLSNTKLYFDEDVRGDRKYVERPHNQDGIGWPTWGTRNNKISCTGANAIRTAMELGYKKIILIGHDASYTPSKKIEGHSQVSSDRYEVTEKSQNPNYFWQDYYEKGDIYNKPGDALPAWKNMADCVSQTYPHVDVVNCSKNSRVTFFRFGEFFKEIGVKNED
tara:strand:+ start:38836 stop:40500 length:1665 start_codon:yes stop_codon:yes gene_type:complete